ncbi:MAG TPA: heavy metal translocating P-type ATPase [Gemmatimonas aurantiaca]|uniref:Cation-transporting P-type ATPase n=2 Tax=Gemmatimonas aurantiaca TaxID=173480 RepID=C1AE96_GEMAT|nr:heavy metal translocating P-type ATPase [Gemmatimonas aurantiaca]BAH40823.1 cation-transporting P-type ATPase [Gemmatimonas aurantiaca T-27]HCT59082.1 heavy metal translocating P-type ATPase [Gemmatimonas aurantiaca]
MSTDTLRLAGTIRTAHPAVGEATLCAHCSLPVPSGLIQESAEHQFCCTGCHTAFAILHEHGLDSYYGFSQRREAPVQASGRSYEEFDHPTFAALYVQSLPGGLSRTELYLEGVHCASCVWLVERVPLLQTGVLRAELDVRRSLAVVEWDPNTITLSAIARSLDVLGYPPHPFRGVARADMRRREDRAMLVRIGISGAIAINMMLAALALYAGELNGMDAGFTHFFRWVSFALMVPAFVWPGRVFFTGAWASVRTKSLHMDLPIAIALAAGLVRGAINTITGTGPIYFDGLALLIFALLVGRFLQQRGQRLAADSAELLHAIAPSTARIVEQGTVREIPAEALLPGMTLDVRAGETFAADGVVVLGQSTVNAALLTGESRPASVQTGELVYAGTLNVEAPLQVRVEQAGETSRIAKLLYQVEESARRRAPIVQTANRLAGIFTAVVLVLAAATFGIKASFNAPHALDDAIALLIVTCPCALALATPLAITVAVSRAAGNGMLIKGGDALELLASPGTMVFDKTGTITEGRTALVRWVGPAWVQPMVLALEAGSSHPLAEGFRQAWPTLGTPDVIDAQHVVGGGLEGTINGHRVRVGSPRFVAASLTATSDVMTAALRAEDDIGRTLTPVHVSVDGELVAMAGMGDRVRDDARTALDTLRANGWRTVLLSGDAVDVVRTVGVSLGFADGQAIGGASPEQKLAFIEDAKRRGRVVMVGDGVNDAAAIAAANVGIGVQGGAEACLATADVYLTRSDLSALVELTDGSRRTLRVIRRNIALSIAYNVVGASMAMFGLLTPLAAAILMPASSITVVLGSWYGFSFPRKDRTPPRGSRTELAAPHVLEVAA